MAYIPTENFNGICFSVDMIHATLLLEGGVTQLYTISVIYLLHASSVDEATYILTKCFHFMFNIWYKDACAVSFVQRKSKSPRVQHELERPSQLMQFISDLL